MSLSQLSDRQSGARRDGRSRTIEHGNNVQRPPPICAELRGSPLDPLVRVAVIAQ
jgi:hypothetical protein